jgi:hypothetical protein
MPDYKEQSMMLPTEKIRCNKCGNECYVWHNYCLKCGNKLRDKCYFCNQKINDNLRGEDRCLD